MFLLPYSMSVTGNWTFQEVSICLGVTQVSPFLWGKFSPTIQPNSHHFPVTECSPQHWALWDREPHPRSCRPGKGIGGHRNCRSKELAQREARRGRLHMDRMAQSVKFSTTVYHQLWRHFRSSAKYNWLWYVIILYTPFNFGSIKLSKQAIPFIQEQEGNNTFTLIFI